jgi:alkylhydroperoxidase family enzyme
VTEPAMRSAVAGGADSGAELPESVREYGAMVRDESYRVTDAVVQRLRAAGWSEDAVFELTIAAAIGAADRGLAAGLEAVTRPREG